MLFHKRIADGKKLFLWILVLARLGYKELGLMATGRVLPGWRWGFPSLYVWSQTLKQATKRLVQCGD